MYTWYFFYTLAHVHTHAHTYTHSNILTHIEGVLDLLVLRASGVVFIFRNIGIQRISEGSGTTCSELSLY